jgi:hypothetical protein
VGALGLQARAAISHLAALRNGHVLHWPVLRPGPGLLNLLHHVHAVDDLAEDNMLVVEIRSSYGRNEELTAVCVWTRVLDVDKSWLLLGEL